MNTTSTTSKPYGQAASTLGDQTSNAADAAAKATQRAIDGVAESLSNTVEDVRSQASPLLDRFSSQAESIARRGIDAVRGGSQQLRDKATHATESTIAYVKDEPVKAMLIAAATGALLMGLVSLMSRSRRD